MPIGLLVWKSWKQPAWWNCEVDTAERKWPHVGVFEPSSEEIISVHGAAGGGNGLWPGIKNMDRLNAPLPTASSWKEMSSLCSRRKIKVNLQEAVRTNHQSMRTWTAIVFDVCFLQATTHTSWFSHQARIQTTSVDTSKEAGWDVVTSKTNEAWVANRTTECKKCW